MWHLNGIFIFGKYFSIDSLIQFIIIKCQVLFIKLQMKQELFL